MNQPNQPETAFVPQPWYREPWPWIIIGMLSSVVIACMVTLYLAMTHYDGLVVEDYYKKGLEINQTLTRDKRSTELALIANIDILPDGTVRATQETKKENYKLPSDVHLRMVHSRYPDQDRNVTFQIVEGDTLIGEVVPPTTGQWHVVLECAEWRIDGNVHAPFEKITLKANS
jgi:hypothetical protein